MATAVNPVGPAEETDEGLVVRRLNAKDAKRVGAMLARVVGDQRLTQALQTEDQQVIMMSIAAVLLDRVPRDISILVADLIGLTPKYDFKKYRKAARKEAKEENLLPPSDEQVRYYMEEEIIEELDEYPPDTYIKVINEVMQKPEFDDFLQSLPSFAKTARMVSSKFASLSKLSSATKTKK
jgi:hypothetical protein